MRRIVLILGCLAFVLFCAGCGDERGAAELLAEICSELELPAGETYLSAAEEGSHGYLPRDTIEFMYGDDAEKNFALLDDYAIYLSSFSVPYEAAVFKCRSASDTDTIAAMCLERADAMKVLLHDTEYAKSLQNAKITQKGRFVIMVIAENSN